KRLSLVFMRVRCSLGAVKQQPALTCCAVVATIMCEQKPAISIQPSKRDVRRLQEAAGDAERSARAQTQGRGRGGKQTWTRNWRKRLSKRSRPKRRASVF